MSGASGLLLVLGLFLGWGVAMLLDRFYWQDRRVCDDMELDLRERIDQLDAQNIGLSSEIGRLKTQTERVSKLEADLTARTAQYNGLLADIDMRKQREAALNTNLQARDSEIQAARSLRLRVQELESQLNDRDMELAKMRTDYESRGAQLSGLTAKVNDLEAQLVQRDDAPPLAATIPPLTYDNSPASTASIDSDEDIVEHLTISEADVVQTIEDVPDIVETPPLQISDAEIAPEASDLGMIWGVNRTVHAQLNDNGINTYHQLANSRMVDVDTALDTASRYYPGMDKQAIHGSWIKQADLAEAGDWDQLSNYQHETIDLANSRDDLKVIWGIGPKIESVMNENGIYTFAQIAAVPSERLTQILHKAGPRFRISSEKVHETWPEQARLADRGEMDALAALQSRLSSRS